MSKFKTFLYTMFLFSLIALSVSFISIHADAKTLQGDGLHGAFTTENFLKQGDAEIVVTGVSNYVNAGATPTTCAGGMPSGGLTVAREKSKAMSGDFYWKITKDSGSQQGEGIAFDFTVDGFTSTEQVQQELYAKVKVIAGSFLFGTNTVSSDIGFYLYDVTASKLVTLGGGNDILGSEVKRWFTPTKDSTQYRLCAHVQTTATNAFTLGLDDLFAGKAQPVSTGAVVTEWKDVTVTGSWTTNTTYSAKMRRIGSEAEFQVRINLSGTPSSGPLEIYLPAGMEFEESALLGATATSGQNSTAYDSSAVLFYDLISFIADKNRVTLRYQSAVTGSTSGVSNSAPFAWDNGDVLIARFTAPIKGWGGTVELADQYLGTDIIFAANKAAGTVNQDTATPFSSIAKDTAGIGNLNGNMTIPVDGDYELSTNLSSTTTGSTLYVWKNGVNTFAPIGLFPTADTAYSYTYKLLDLKEGDVITVRPDGNKNFTIHQITLTRINASEGTQAFRPDTFYPADVDTNEFQVGWDRTVTPPKPIYKRCHKVVSNVSANGTVLATWPANLKAAEGGTTGSVVLYSDFATGVSNTDAIKVVYIPSNGNIQIAARGSSYTIPAGENICMRYTKP